MVHRNVDDYAVGAFSYHPTHFIIQTMKCYIRNFTLVRAVNVNAVIDKKIIKTIRLVLSSKQ